MVYLARIGIMSVSKDDLFEISPGADGVVSESTCLAISICAQAVGDSGVSRPIRTVARKGFRFVGRSQRSRATLLKTQVHSRRAEHDFGLPIGRRLPSWRIQNLSGDLKEYFAPASWKTSSLALPVCACLFVIAATRVSPYKGGGGLEASWP